MPTWTGVTRAAQITLLLVLAALPGVAFAGEPRPSTSSLSWVRLSGAEGCIGTQALAHGIEQRLRRKVFVSASEADVSVEGHVARNDGARGWQATVSVRDAKGTLLGTRHLKVGDGPCSALNDELEFAISLMIDPDAALGGEPPPPPPPVAAPVTPPASPQVVIQRETVFVPTEVTKPEPWRFEGGGGLAAGLGLLPAAAVGVTASAILEPPHFWGIRLAGAIWHDASIDAERGATSEVSLAYGSVGLCPFRVTGRSLMSRGCAGTHLGSQRSRGVGFDKPIADETLVVHAFALGQFGVRLAGPLWATVTLSLVVPITRSELSYRAEDGSDRELFRASPIAGTGELGFALSFP